MATTLQQRTPNTEPPRRLVEVITELADTDYPTAVHCAHEAGLITDLDLLTAWETGIDVLALVRIRAAELAAR